MLSSPRRGTIATSVAIAVLLTAGALPAWSQSRCVARLRAIERRDLPTFSELSTTRARSIFADAAECSVTDSAKPPLIRPLLPRIRLTYAGGLPDADEEGEMWSGRGITVALRGGVVFEKGFLHVVIAPEIIATQNASFDHEGSRDTSRSSSASPFYSGKGFSLDYPTQFGASAFTRATPGASTAWISQYNISLGISASPQQWGPGTRGSLLLGAASQGIPRVFLRTSSPVEGSLGVFDAVMFIGTITESQYFDHNPNNNYRSLSSLGVSWSPTQAGHFTVGIARAVMHPIFYSVPNVKRTLDVFRPTNHNADEMESVFMRVGSATDALSAWAEVARNKPGFGLHSFLTIPYDAVSYIIGARAIAPLKSGTLVALAEAANLEQGEDIVGEGPHDFYSGNVNPQGWTQRGRPIGDGIGPGGQSQFASLDWIFHSSRIGGFVERVRRNEDALFREYLAYPNRHDVSLEAGVRSAHVWFGQEISTEVSIGRRINFEFQNAIYLPNVRTVDVWTPRIRFSVTPLAQRQ
ncbi:MAG: hypothetical protein ABJB66_00535 [Gemmatimonadaceae bacterium]